MKRIFLFIAAITSVLLIFLSACNKKPTAPKADNSFDPANVQTGGDSFKLTAKIANGGVLLTWNKPPLNNLKSFNIYRSENEGNGYSELGTVNASTTKFTDKDIANGHSYWYVVTAVNSKGEESSRTNLEPMNIKTQPVLVINGGDQYTPTRIVNLTILANTAKQMMLSNTADFTGAQWKSYATSKSWTLTEGEGEKTVYLKVKYENGQESQPVSANIKPQPMNPSIVVIADTVEYTPTRNVTLKLSATGVNLKMKLSEDSTFSGVNWQDYSSEPSFILSTGDGVKKVYAKFKNDFEIESSTLKDDIIMDTTPPTLVLTVTPDSGITNETTFQFDPTGSSDNLTAKQDLRIIFDWENDGTFDTNWQELRITNYEFQVGGGDKTVRMQLKDGVGWQVETTKNIFVNTRPQAAFTATQTNNLPITVFYDASSSTDYEDGHSLQYRWDFDGDGVFDTNWLTQDTISHVFKQDGTYQTQLNVRDQNFLNNQRIKEINVKPFVEMVFVQGGTFQMGDIWKTSDGTEKPVHTVTVNSFYISKYEVTQAQYQEIMGNNPSYFIGENLPVEKISWYDAVQFCNKLSEREGLEPCYTINGTDVTCDFTKNGYRLPTEAEWEYAARGGNQSHDYHYSGSDKVDEVAWYRYNSGEHTHEVGTKQPNELGIYDMSGNVWEWCWDWYNWDYYNHSPQDNPRGPSGGKFHVERGGSCAFPTMFMTVSFRSIEAHEAYPYRGMRLVRKY